MVIVTPGGELRFVMNSTGVNARPVILMSSSSPTNGNELPPRVPMYSRIVLSFPAQSKAKEW